MKTFLRTGAIGRLVLRLRTLLHMIAHGRRYLSRRPTADPCSKLKAEDRPLSLRIMAGSAAYASATRSW